VSVEVMSSAALPTVLGDPEQIAQAIMSVAVNARDAVRLGGGRRLALAVDTLATDGGRAGRLHAELVAEAESPLLAEAGMDGLNRLWLGTLPPARYHVVRVEDDGPGMDLATLERIFDPFFTTKGQPDGSGLGLSAAQGIVLAHGGAIAVETGPGFGTRMSLFLPAAATIEAKSDDAVEPRNEAGAERRGLAG
jgi:signal transduction histidine kinase